MPLRTVLIPLDGTEYSRRIDRVVRMYISPDDVKLVLFLVVCPPASAAHVQGTYESSERGIDAGIKLSSEKREALRRELEVDLTEDVDRLRRAGYSATVEVHFGEAVQQIIDYVNEHHIDLVAMPRFDRNGTGISSSGSTTEQIVRGISAPVLFMRTDGQ